jgi:hypothetical protein
MNKAPLFLSFLIGVFTSFYSFSNTCTAITSGNWSNGAIWSCGIQTSCGDIIIIPSGIIVTVDEIVGLDANSTPQCNQPTGMIIDGTLVFQTGKKINLGCGSAVAISPAGSMIPGNGGGNSNWLSICSIIKWNTSSGTVSGPVVYVTPTSLPLQLIDFKATIENTKLNASWTVESNEFVDHFLLSISADGSNWKSLATVNTKAFTGTITYSSTDEIVESASQYYVSLSAIAKDGTNDRLKTIVVANKGLTLLSANPLSQGDPILLSLQPNEHVRIVDITGKEMFVSTASNEQLQTIETSSFTAGTYYFSSSLIGTPIRIVIQ